MTARGLALGLTVLLAVRAAAQEPGAAHLRWRAHEQGGSAIAASADGRTLASAGLDGSVRLWDPATGAPRGVLHPHEGEVYAVALARDGSRLLSSGLDGRVVLSDVTTGAAVRTLAVEGWSIALAWAPDEREAAAAGPDGAVVLWELETGQERLRLTGPPRVSALEYSPDGATIAVAAGRVELWERATGRKLRELGTHAASVRDLAFAPDGRRLASASLDGTLRLWDVDAETPGLRLECRGLVRTFQGRTLVDPVRMPALAAVFSPDGALLAAAGAGRAVDVHDAVHGERVATLHGHTAAITGLAALPGEAGFVSCSLDRTLAVWRW